MADKVTLPAYARYCVVGPVGTPGGLRETVRLMNDGNSMRPVKDVLGDLNEMIWDAFPKEWLKAYDRRRYKAEALARIRRNSLPWMEGGFHTAAWMRLDCKESLWPARWSWLAVYAVTGTSEGHYVHIDLIGCPGDGQVEHMAMVKTFSGWERQV